MNERPTSVRGRAGRKTDLRIQNFTRRHAMKWSAPIVAEICVGMEVTSYESAEIDTFN
ncbi:coenzyme pyrroloquinoline quinone (PQQ) biosynthesis protein A (modular protein) [Methylorubrum extorquens]|nr:coenzyme pyrroloquinoline quinone (PQQ) biosynthesis protein A (modular protein) [Methylorubrum extorquens]